MKQLALSVLGLATVHGQAVDGSNVFRYFGSCFENPCYSDDMECCSFDAGNDVTGQFCMTENQKLDPKTGEKSYFGKYVDNEFTNWDWVCRAPTAAEIAEETRKKREAERDALNPPFKQIGWLEYVIWTTHLSGLGWILGWIIMAPLGVTLYTGLVGLSMWNIVEVFLFGIGNLNMWMNGPLRRGLVGWLILSLNLLTTAIPGVNFVSSPLYTWWALADYYDYKFDPIFGERPEEFK